MNIMESLSCQVENLYYSTIERKIISYYDMGYAESSNLPIEMNDNSSGNYSISATRKFGEFSIRTAKRTDGTFQLYISVIKLKGK